MELTFKPLHALDLKQPGIEEMAALAEEALASTWRRNGNDATAPPLWIRNRLGITPSGQPGLLVEHPRVATRPSWAKMAERPIEHHDPEAAALNLTGPQRERRLWLSTVERWHPLDEGLALLLADDGPRADLERRRAIDAQESEQERAAAAAEKLHHEAEERRRMEAQRAREHFATLTREQQAFIVAAARMPEHAPLFRTLAEIFGADRIAPPPGYWPSL